jgi:type IV secretory pathway VirD2 relaxase
MGSVCCKPWELTRAQREIEEQRVKQYGQMPSATIHIDNGRVTVTKGFQKYVENLQEQQAKQRGVGTEKTREEFKRNLLRFFSEEEAERMTAEEYDKVIM